MRGSSRVALGLLAVFPVLIALRNGLDAGADLFAAQDHPALVMPPRNIANISIDGNLNPKEITWGEPRDGLALGIARLRTSPVSPVWPIVDAYLENRGSERIAGTILSRESFRIELDGRAYSAGDYGGKGSTLFPGQQLGPVLVEGIWFHQIDKMAAVSPVDDNAPGPALSAGEHTLQIYFNWNGKLVPGASVTFAVDLQPYPMTAAVAQIARDLQHRDSHVRSRAATLAGRLQLSGAHMAVRDALLDHEFSVRNSAARALGVIGDRSTIEALKPLLNDRDMDVRVSAIESRVKLGAPFDIAWAEPIVRSKQGNAFQNAIWLIRRHGRDLAAPTLIRCLDMNDPSVKSYYNYTLVWQIGACGGPQLRYHHDFDGNGTLDQVAHNRKVLTDMQEWLRARQTRKMP
jgi:hypothetical protein